MHQQSIAAKQETFKKLAKVFMTSINRLTFPTRRIAAGTSVFRFVGNEPNRRLDYFDLFRQHPKGSEMLHRWSGRRWDGNPGTSGSYWGSTDGISAESFFYSCVIGYDPSTGPRRLLPPMTPLVVAGAQSRLPYHAEQDAPGTIPFSGNYNTDILIARTNHDIEVVDMDVTSARFHEWNHRITRAVRAELEAIEFADIAAAMSDSQFKDLARLIGNLANANAHRALAAKSVRQNVYRAPGYDPSQANSLILFGDDRESITDKLTGTGVIQIRPSPLSGAEATVRPLTVYPANEERALVSVRSDSSPPSTKIFMSASNPVSDKEESGS